MEHLENHPDWEILNYSLVLLNQKALEFLLEIIFGVMQIRMECRIQVSFACTGTSNDHDGPIDSIYCFALFLIEFFISALPGIKVFLLDLVHG